MKTENESFLKAILNRLRAKKKKLDKILGTEKKIKNKEIAPNQEQVDSLSQKADLQIVVNELEYVVTAIKQQQEEDDKANASKPNQAPVKTEVEEVKIDMDKLRSEVEEEIKPTIASELRKQIENELKQKFTKETEEIKEKATSKVL
jgi:hypothetical protein